MKKSIIVTFLAFLLIPTLCRAREYYISPEGSDTNAGSKSSPFASLAHVQSLVSPGDVVYIRGGVYKPTNEEIMGVKENLYNCVFIMDRSGSEGAPICYYGYPGERPVFDLSEVFPSQGRISVFYVCADYLHLKNFEIVGTRVIPSSGNTQSECISNRGGSHNIYENLAMHDGQAIGFYLVKGADNLVLNCDAYNNFEDVTGSGNGGNVDGFGCHPAVGDTGNVLRGCRAWWNSDDGYDFIHSAESVSIDHCWAFYNGYKPREFKSAGDGNGIKAGGYGMNADSKIPEVIPTHIVTNCLAYRNKAGGIYSNHHLGGLTFMNNTSFYNRYNYNMVCRKSKAEPVDVSGYGHILVNNLSYNPRETDISNIDYSLSTLSNNSFYPVSLNLDDSDFKSLDPEQLLYPRNPDGSLPQIEFMVPTAHSVVSSKKMGYTFETDPDSDIGEVTESNWLMFPTIVIDGEKAMIVGTDAENFTKMYVNGTSVKVSKCSVDLTGFTGTLELRANSTTGGIIKKTIKR